MLPPLRRWIGGSILLVSLFLLLWHTLLDLVPHHQRVPPQAIDRVIHPGFLKPKFRWRDLPQQHPLHEYTPLPSGPKVSIPPVQHDFAPETLQQAAERQRRLSAVEAAFRHSKKLLGSTYSCEQACNVSRWLGCLRQQHRRISADPYKGVLRDAVSLDAIALPLSPHARYLLTP